MHEQLSKLIPDHLAQKLGVHSMTPEQQDALFRWAMHMFSLGRHVIADIEDVKYDGHLVVLDDGSRWEVDDIDRSTVAMWSMLDKVLVVDGEMWKLDESEKVNVSEAE